MAHRIIFQRNSIARGEIADPHFAIARIIANFAVSARHAGTHPESKLDLTPK